MKQFKFFLFSFMVIFLFASCGDKEESACKKNERQTQVCGEADAGKQDRTCEDGSWSDWGTCVMPAECTNGATEKQACGEGDAGEQSRTCENDAWSAWGDCVMPAECTDGEKETQACGEENAGTQSRSCVEGVWADWSACNMPAECTENATETQSCGEGDAGEQTRTCENGTWSDWGDCVMPPECTGDAIQTQACGENGGEQTRSCEQGAWGAWGLCVECSTDETQTQACGENGGEQTRTCENSAWSDWGICVECTDGATETQVCGEGDAGEQTRTCENSAWSAWGDCDMSCVNGTMKEGESCGTDGVLISVCKNQVWGEELCHKTDGEYRVFTVYLKQDDDSVTSYLMDAAESAWNYFNSIHLGLREQAGGPVSYHPALRFENIQLPANAEVADVSLSFFPSNDVDHDKIRINIYGEKSVSSQPFDITNYNNNRPDQRLKTSAKAPEDTHNPESWRIECVSDCCKDEPDCTFKWRYDCPQRKLDCWKRDTRVTVPHNLSPLLTEVLALDGWEAGNAFTLFMISAINLNAGDDVGNRTLHDYDEVKEKNPSLTIKYRVIE